MFVGIVGVGAIGGSIGLRARRNGARVLGFDREPAALQNARDLGAIDESVPVADLRRTDVLVIAAHLEATLAEIARLRDEGGAPPKLIVDVASVKTPVVRAAGGLPNFVATHPMAGTERSGVAAARADLFDDRPWAYVPSGDAELDERARRFIVSLGGVPVGMSAQEHDRIVAITSHVPQAVAYCYARLLREGDAGAERLCGPVARELLRIAAMSPAMWRPIFAANATNVERELRRLAAELSAAADELSREDTSS
jgi:prephenate dehydrogenase